ncbi:hypothetical protein HY995_01555, partial [Candidatus Micrarchaeota archaeon]|nr:hypothetical protein [Candidatus Micrarchaeota archaeon]
MDVTITSTGVSLPLTQARGAVRIADVNGNHISKPTQARNLDSNLVEWMITNLEVSKLSSKRLDKQVKAEIAGELQTIKEFIWATEYAKRETLKTTTKEIAEVMGFKVYEYTEKFYSFEKELASK